MVKAHVTGFLPGVTYIKCLEQYPGHSECQLRVSRCHYYCFICHMSERVRVSEVVVAGGERKGSFGSRAKLGRLCRRPESAAGISELIRCFPPTPTGLGTHVWWPRRSETARQEAASSVSRCRGLSEALRGETTPPTLLAAVTVTSCVWQPPCLQAALRTEGTEVQMPSNRMPAAPGLVTPSWLWPQRAATELQEGTNGRLACLGFGVSLFFYFF